MNEITLFNLIQLYFKQRNLTIPINKFDYIGNYVVQPVKNLHYSDFVDYVSFELGFYLPLRWDPFKVTFDDVLRRIIFQELHA